MKRIVIFLAATSFLGINTWAQEVKTETKEVKPEAKEDVFKVPEVKADSRSMVTGVQPALIMNLVSVDPKFADSEWKEYMKSYGKVEKVKGSKEYVVQGIHVGDIGKGELLNVYHYASQASDGTEFIVWFSRGGNYLKSSDPEYPRGVKFLQTFAHKVKVDMIAIDLEEQNKKLEKLDGTLARLVKDNDNLHKVIETNNGKIAQAQTDIPLNERAQEAALADIDKQKSVLESVKDNPEEYKIQQKLMAKLEANHEKLVKENASLQKTVTDSQAKIKQAELDIDTNEEEQKATQTLIEEQKKVVTMVQDKLSTTRNQKPE